MTAGGRSMAPSHGVIRLMEHQSTSVCVKFGIPVYLDYMILIEACRVVSGAQSEKGETNSAGKQECEARLAPPTITQFKGEEEQGRENTAFDRTIQKLDWFRWTLFSKPSPKQKDGLLSDSLDRVSARRSELHCNCKPHYQRCQPPSYKLGLPKSLIVTPSSTNINTSSTDEALLRILSFSFLFSTLMSTS
ncbi:unnamed protein product [Fusarium graminearum]|uniref:Uncharacterized protein n=1 Tax=Gibberella zeae TaxID=5518 RepID=A0A4E9DZ46_GIBZA|nr:unnamed protein product [Fusarium graminearum]CAG1969080.1 unnamed protein product [Fusarium graminearum]CAG1998671.1 unnamed protein product [Fusarium graminearum]